MPKCPSTAAPRGHARLARPRRGRAAQRNKTLAPGALPAASVPPGSQVRSLGVRCRPMRPLVGPLTGLFQEAPAGGRLGAELPAAGAAPEGPIGGWHQPTHTRTHSNPCNLHCGTAELRKRTASNSHGSQWKNQNCGTHCGHCGKPGRDASAKVRGRSMHRPGSLTGDQVHAECSAKQHRPQPHSGAGRCKARPSFFAVPEDRGFDAVHHALVRTRRRRIAPEARPLAFPYAGARAPSAAAGRRVH